MKWYEGVAVCVAGLIVAGFLSFYFDKKGECEARGLSLAKVIGEGYRCVEVKP
jgi:hypothetical protein